MHTETPGPAYGGAAWNGGGDLARAVTHGDRPAIEYAGPNVIVGAVENIYYPFPEATRRRPYGLYVHGGMDTAGAVRAVESITTGLQWRAIRPPVTVTGPPGKQDLEACWELGALLAAEIAG